MAGFQTLWLNRDGAVVTIALNRPHVRNAFNALVIDELGQAAGSLRPSDRVLVLTGEGKAFCAGADLEWMKASAKQSEDENHREAANMAAMFCALNQSPRVVIGRINGSAFGGGLGLIACCDIAVAVEHAQFAFTEARLGLVPAVVAPFVLDKIGAGWTRRYFVSGETFTSAAALEMGLIHEVVAAEKLDEVVARLAEGALQCGPNAVIEAKKLLRTVAGQDRDDALETAVATIARLRRSPEGQEGLSAFLDKREANWREST